MVVGQCDQLALHRVCPKGPGPLYDTFFQKYNGHLVTVDEQSRLMYIYQLGLIDVLQPYNWLKSQANWIKWIRCGSAEVRDTVDADAYQGRFLKYFEKRIVGDARLLDRAECAAVTGADTAGGNAATPQRPLAILWI